MYYVNDLPTSRYLDNFSLHFSFRIEHEIIGEGSQISTNQKRESTVSWLLIGRNLRPFPDNFVLYIWQITPSTKTKTRLLKSPEKNQYAMNVLKRVQSKLEGRDGGVVLSVPDQVTSSVDVMSRDNISRVIMSNSVMTIIHW